MDKIHTFIIHKKLFDNHDINDHKHEEKDSETFLIKNKEFKNETLGIDRKINVNNKFCTNANTINNNDKDEKKENKYIEFGFGNYHIYYNLNPLHSCLYYELLNNSICSISSINFDDTFNKAKIIIEKDDIQILKASYNGMNEDYGIDEHDPISLPYVMSIMFYTNYDTLCSKFRRSFYNKNRHYHYSTTRPNKEGSSIEYFFLGRFLFCAITYFGTKGNKDDEITFYHGLSSKMLFKGLSAMFSTPTSVTDSIRVARVKKIYLFLLLIQ